MKYEIIWSPLSEKDLEKNLEYLEENWDQKVILNYINRIDEVLCHISNNPLMYPEIIKRSNIHKCVLNKQTILYYRIKGKIIELITFFNARQDPEKLKL